MECFFLVTGTVAVDLRDDCGDWIPSPGFDKNIMKPRQPVLRGIPQFDSGRWKLRLERVPVDFDNETTMSMDFDSAVQAGLNKSSETHSFLLPIERGRRER